MRAARTNPRRRKLLKAWMIKHEPEIRLTEVARSLGISPQAVSRYLSGDMNSRNIREYFIRRGCPERYLERAA